MAAGGGPRSTGMVVLLVGAVAAAGYAVVGWVRGRER
jgi:hypothetical protein